MSTRQRRPAAFRLDDPHVVVTMPEESQSSTAHRVQVTLEPDAALPIVAGAADPLRRRGFAWGTLFWSAAGGLVLLGLGLAATSFIEDLFARNAGLGSLGLALAALAATSLVVIIVREAAGLMRLAEIEKLRERAAAALATDERREGIAVAAELVALMRRTPRLARARATIAEHLGDIIDGADRVRMAERALLGPLDQDARALVGAAATRVSLVTAVSPRAVVDMLFVLANTLGLVRRLSLLYGGRPGTLGFLRLMRLVVSHLAMTGGLAAGDSLIQQVFGHGVAAKLSARLGEGMLNGLLTARLGLAAIELTRPLPFAALPRPTLSDLAGDLLRKREDQQIGSLG
jgi:putative membrane protein